MSAGSVSTANWVVQNVLELGMQTHGWVLLKLAVNMMIALYYAVGSNVAGMFAGLNAQSAQYECSLYGNDV